jgi:hypothetical protein
MDAGTKFDLAKHLLSSGGWKKKASEVEREMI